MLSEQYPAETTLNLIIWSPADIEALADGMEYAVSELDTGRFWHAGRHPGRTAP
jgi:hypothetical protein